MQPRVRYALMNVWGNFIKQTASFCGRYVPTANQVFIVYRIMKYERDLRDSVSQRFLMS